MANRGEALISVGEANWRFRLVPSTRTWRDEYVMWTRGFLNGTGGGLLQSRPIVTMRAMPDTLAYVSTTS
jgi:hypothetical protein